VIPHDVIQILRMRHKGTISSLSSFTLLTPNLGRIGATDMLILNL